MKLETVQVTNYRCVEDSEPFDLDQVTCLVGKNESGKTSILTAIHSLNPHSGGAVDKVRDYPRRFLADYSERHPRGDARFLRTVWQYDQADLDALVALFGPAASSLTSVEISKSYGGDITWTFGIDEEQVVKHLIATSGLHDEERRALEHAKTVDALKTAFDGATSDRHRAFEQRLKKEFPESNGGLNHAAWKLIQERLPKILYFSQYTRMQGQVALKDLQAREKAKTLRENDHIFLSLCELAGAPLEDVATINQFEPMLAKFEAASNKITSEIFEYWTQNRYLEVQFRRDHAEPGDPAPLNDGYIFRTRILNQLHRASLIFDERSAGFVWFFSFLVLFSQLKKRHGTNLLILLDEPGLNLHARAQEDLLRFIHERLAPSYQVIYTTHSPFMVPADDLLSVRTVEDVLEQRPTGGPPIVHGTKVRSDVLKVDRDTLFPLQGALGYEITQSLFVGRDTLLVEGPSDLLFLRAFSEHLLAHGGRGLSPRWTICPVGGLEKVGAFLSLFGGNKLSVAVLVDVGHGQKRTVEELKRLTDVLRKGRILTIPTYAGQQEADIEDLLGADGYVSLVNTAYGLAGAAALKIPSTPVPRIVNYVEAEMRTRTTVPEFDHYFPAEYLAANREVFLKTGKGKSWVTDAAKCFQALFDDLNPLLSK